MKFDLTACSQKTSTSSKIKTNLQNNNNPPTTAGPSHKPAPVITSSSRLTPSNKASLKSRPTKLPVASKKRRFSTLKTTTVPVRSSPRLHPPSVDQHSSMISQPTDSQSIAVMPTSPPVPAAPIAADSLIQDLLQRNKELQLTLDNANRRIAELEASAKTSAPPTSSTSTAPAPPALEQLGGTSES
ncbi:hypothetical protein [Parasitella parasitica]|uniref:Uncharacterized protein n=1 Tax=Parasitella parasitica TaxID=35722 RepID=A0A0B7NKV7_9FUNG|nr:hypothetical protein [Parasitella parasitica]